MPFNKGPIIEDWQVKNESVKQLLMQLNFLYVPEEHIYYRPMHGNKKALEAHLFREICLLYEKQKPVQDITKGAFTWSHPRRSWENAKRPVFIDFGEDELYWVTKGLGKYQGTGIKIRKEKFIEKYSV